MTGKYNIIVCLNNYIEIFYSHQEDKRPGISLRDNTLLRQRKEANPPEEKYLGKNVEGVPIKVHSQEKVPKKVLSHGEFKPLERIIEDLELEKTLSDVLPAKKVWQGLNVGDELCDSPSRIDSYPELV